MEKVNKLIWFPKELFDRIDEYRKQRIAENIKNDVEDFDMNFTQTVLQLIEDGLDAKKK